MSTNIADGGPAFPIQVIYDAAREQINPVTAYYDAGGMSLRDYFAAQALPLIPEVAKAFYRNWETWLAKDIATEAYRIADAMLAARSNQ